MYQGKLVVAGLMAFLLTGCAQKSDTNAAAADADPAAVTPSELTEKDSLTPIEISASTKPLQVSDQRPIPLPDITYQPVTRGQTFEFGNDAPLDETSGVRNIVYHYNPVNNSGPARFAPSYPERPVPQRGMQKEQVLASAGTPANQMVGSRSEIWDYGTYRVFFSDDIVAFTRVW